MLISTIFAFWSVLRKIPGEEGETSNIGKFNYEGMTVMTQGRFSTLHFQRREQLSHKGLAGTRMCACCRGGGSAENIASKRSFLIIEQI